MKRLRLRAPAAPVAVSRGLQSKELAAKQLKSEGMLFTPPSPPA
jgi:hypothetical protein